MVKVLADKHLYKITDFTPENFHLELFNPDTFSHPIPDGTQALLIRTVTKINPQTFPFFPDALEFIGTGSAGADHVDIPYLKKNDITFADAAGCNARSVGEYVATALLLWADANDINIQENTVGIIGAGHTGSAVQKILEAMVVNTITYDPPRQEREAGFQSADLDKVLQSDILTFHTPLTLEQPHATFHWLDEEKLANYRFKLIINAARGGVIDEQALLNAHRQNKVDDFILDVWESEPDFNDDVARHAFLKTPHIAGYSVQAKNRASRMIAKALSNHFGIKAPEANTRNANDAQSTPPSTFWSLTDALTFYHPIRDYETRFLMLVGRSPKKKIEGFNHIRTRHPLRDELHFLNLPSQLQEKFPLLKTLFA